MMKHFKLLFVSFALITGLFTSCSKNEPISEELNIQKTEAITLSLNRLSQQFNSDGNVTASGNPSGNIVFDFGFDFVYPLHLSFNNNSSVYVNSLDDLIEILINSSTNLYIDGIQFPFNVEVYDENSNSIVVITINSEAEFYDLIESLDWDDQDECDCYQNYNPVCVEVTDVAGVVFTVTYPNSCYAICDGFDADDFIDSCEGDYNGNTTYECFTFNFPISVITDQNLTITVNSQEELNTAVYNSFYFGFVYPFNVTTEEGDVETIENQESFNDLLEDCYDDLTDDCECYQDYNPVCVQIETPTGNLEIIEFDNECYAICEGFSAEDFVNCEIDDECDCDDEENITVCVEVEVDGQIEIYSFLNACLAECEGYTEADFVDCSGNTDCTTENVVIILLECPWTLNGTTTYEFNSDNTVEITGSGLSTTGEWSIEMSNDGYPIVSIISDIGNFSDDWHFVDCNQVNSLTVTSSVNPAAEIFLNCD